MFKKLILILFVSVPLVYSQQHFKSDVYGFEMTFPDYMLVKNGTNESQAVHASLNENAFINVNLQIDSALGYKVIEDYSLDEFLSPVREMLNNELNGYTLMDYGWTEINKDKAIYMQYKYIRSRETVRVKQFYMISRLKLYAITILINENEAADFEPVFDECLNSFRFVY